MVVWGHLSHVLRQNAQLLAHEKTNQCKTGFDLYRIKGIRIQSCIQEWGRHSYVLCTKPDVVEECGEMRSSCVEDFGFWEPFQHLAHIPRSVAENIFAFASVRILQYTMNGLDEFDGMASHIIPTLVDDEVNGTESHADTKPLFQITFPQRDDQNGVFQDAEVFDVVIKQRIRIHDYDILFAYPHLYEYIRYPVKKSVSQELIMVGSHVIEDVLGCQSPQKMVGLLKQQLCSDAPNLSRGPLRILDVAAGNGRVGAELRDQLGKSPGIKHLVRTDLLESARLATIRDRKPYPYDDYVVANLLDTDTRVQWQKNPFNVVTVCAALGPGEGDLPLQVLDAVVNFLKEDGFLVFTVNSGVECCSGRYKFFLDSLKKMDGDTYWPSLRKIDTLVYNHRLSVKGDWIEYAALVYQKTG